jgi:hypothetical protein
MKIPPVEADLFRADGQKDGQDKPNSRFSQFYERAQKRAARMWNDTRYLENPFL